MSLEYPEICGHIPLGTLHVEVTQNGADYFVELRQRQWPYLSRKKLTRDELFQLVCSKVQEGDRVIVFCSSEDRAFRKALSTIGATCQNGKLS